MATCNCFYGDPLYCALDPPPGHRPRAPAQGRGRGRLGRWRGEGHIATAVRLTGSPPMIVVCACLRACATKPLRRRRREAGVSLPPSRSPLPPPKSYGGQVGHRAAPECLGSLEYDPIIFTHGKDGLRSIAGLRSACSIRAGTRPRPGHRPRSGARPGARAARAAARLGGTSPPPFA